MACHTRAKRRIVCANIGVVGRDHEPADKIIVGTVGSSSQRDQNANAGQNDFTFAGFRGRRFRFRCGCWNLERRFCHNRFLGGWLRRGFTQWRGLHRLGFGAHDAGGLIT